VASPASGAILRFRGDEVEVEHLAGTRRELLRTDPEALRVRMGELAFGESTRSGVSCASCHPGGGSDFSGHNIGGRFLAPTLDARGLAGTAPFLRDGSYPRIRDLMEVADHEYRGYRWPAGDRGATIEGFLLRTVRPALGVVRDPDLVRRGGEVFERAGCNQCHAPPAFTDLGQHAGVALFPRHDFPPNVRSLDTPSLRGVAESPPYLHDGRARTLEETLRKHHRSSKMTGQADPTDEELADLVAFLRSL
jgi:mono/diheme cytochrome c family protein